MLTNRSCKKLLGGLAIIASGGVVWAQYISADTYTRYELLAPETHLKFEVVSGTQAKADSPAENFSPTAKYIKVYLTHPIPERGEYRLAIIKTYKDDKSYYSEGDQIVFKRPLSIPRNSVVLPLGYEIVSCSVATQVLREADGRLKLAFVNAGSGGSLEVAIRAKKLKSVPPAVVGGSSLLEVER